MKKRYFYIILFSSLLVTSICVLSKEFTKYKNLKTIEIAYKEPEYKYNEIKEESKKEVEESLPVASTKDIVWDGLTEEELAQKLDKNLYHELSSTGKYFAHFTAETGLDPYLAVSIVNLETGCKWKCSYLARKCNNIGGIKGKPSCNGGSYARYTSLEDGINSYLNLVYKGYWLKGLTTAEKMNKKYAESSTWAKKVNAYYETIKAS